MDGEPTFRVRAATAADADAIAAVNVAAARAGWSGFMNAERLARFEAPAERWRAMLAEPFPRRTVLVATDADRVVGFASVAKDAAEGPRVAELTTLYTDPAVWGRGAGRVLMRDALRALAASGAAEAVLWTEERNERPRRIYELAGWRLDGGRREREFLGVPIRELRYRIALAPSRASPPRREPRSSTGR